jgi:hypothetical protein
MRIRSSVRENPFIGSGVVTCGQRDEERDLVIGTFLCLLLAEAAWITAPAVLNIEISEGYKTAKTRLETCVGCSKQKTRPFMIFVTEFSYKRESQRGRKQHLHRWSKLSVDPCNAVHVGRVPRFPPPKRNPRRTAGPILSVCYLLLSCRYLNTGTFSEYWMSVMFGFVRYFVFEAWNVSAVQIPCAFPTTVWH